MKAYQEEEKVYLGLETSSLQVKSIVVINSFGLTKRIVKRSIMDVNVEHCYLSDNLYLTKNDIILQNAGHCSEKLEILNHLFVSVNSIIFPKIVSNEKL